MKSKATIKGMANFVVDQGLGNTTDGRWNESYEDINETFDTIVTDTNDIGRLLQEELKRRDEVAECIMTEDCIELTYHLEHCPQCQTGGIGGMMSLFSLMGCNLEDVHLVHDEEEHDLATVVQLNRDTLTAEGKKDWRDVLLATVKRVYAGSYGTQIELSGCSPQRLGDFSYMLAGHCASKDYDRWVCDGQEKMEDVYKNSRAVDLIVTYEEVYGVPHDQQITHYFGDYGSHYLNHGVTDEQVKAAYEKGLAAIQMDGPTFQKTDDFLCRSGIIDRMRACVLAKELKTDMCVFFVPSEPLIGANGFRYGEGTIDRVYLLSLTCDVSGEEIRDSMNIPLHHVVARYEPGMQNKHFGLKNALPLYSAHDNYARDLLLQAEKRWEESSVQEEDAPIQSM